MFHIVQVLSLKLITIVRLPNPLSLSDSILKLALKYAAIAPLVNSFAVKIAVEIVA